jgi:uncharacterized protein DUF4386
MDETKKTARLAGLLYLVSSIPAPFALLYVPGKLLVRGDAAATADRIRASETLFRMGITAELAASVVFIFVALTLYRLFKPVSEGAALAMLVLILISFPISFLNVLNDIAALNFAGVGSFSNVLSVFDAHQRDALAYLSLRMHGQGIVVAAQIFWGLWLFPFGICVMRSGFIPRVLGILLMVAGCGYVATSLAPVALPAYAGSIDQVAKILALGEVPIIFWLLIWGAKPQRTGALAPHTAG